MAYLILTNDRDVSKRLNLDFTEQEYADALADLSIPFEQRFLEVDNVPAGLHVETMDLWMPTPHSIHFDDPVMINFMWKAYDECDYQYAVDAYIEDIGIDNEVEFINLCLDAENVGICWFDQGSYYEGWGHYLIDYCQEELPEWAESYFDYDQYGRDNDNYVYIHEDFAHDPEMNSPDLGYYDIDDMYCEYGWSIDYEPTTRISCVLNNNAVFNFL